MGTHLARPRRRDPHPSSADAPAEPVAPSACSKSHAKSLRRNEMPCRNLKLIARADRRFIRSTYRSNRFVLAEITAPHAHHDEARRRRPVEPHLRRRSVRLHVRRQAPPGQAGRGAVHRPSSIGRPISPSSSTTTTSRSCSRASWPRRAPSSARCSRSIRWRRAARPIWAMAGCAVASRSRAIWLPRA